MSVGKCECCGRDDQPEGGVACSALGAFSLYYCGPCAVNRAEPEGMVRGVLEDTGGKPAPWVLDLTVFLQGAYRRVGDVSDTLWATTLPPQRAP